MSKSGIDVSKDKNTVTIRRPGDIVIMSPRGIFVSAVNLMLIKNFGDVTHFTHRGALTAFAGVDPGKNEGLIKRSPA